jgi:CheY-like chemotaxis protein
MKALLVEDNPADVTLFRLALEAIPESIDLCVAGDGEKALEFLHRNGQNARGQRPDFILLDLNLPRKGGLEVLGELKSDPDLRRIPVIVLTSSGSPAEIARAYDLQAAAYFVKPLSGFDRIVHAIVEFMNAAEPPGTRRPGPLTGVVLTDAGVEVPPDATGGSSSDAAIVIDATGAVVMVNHEGVLTGGELPELGPVDAGAALDQALANLRSMVRELRAEIVRHDMPTVTADHDLMVRLFENLIGNALRYCAPGRTRIEIAARRSPPDWIFSVADNGIGIDRKHFDRIFHLFQRLQRRDASPGACGSLVVCERIVARLGGRIWVESAPGASAAFFFTVPDHPGECPCPLPPSAGAA